MNATVAADAPLSFSMRLLERNLVPDGLIRRGIRKLLAERLREEDMGNPEAQQKRLMDLIARLKASPIAINTIDANAQHYEVPTEFYLNVLGPNLKYSSCYYETPNDTLQQAEERMLALTCQRAKLKDGDSILELGCGWGSLSLWMAKQFPNSRIVAVSNSRTQKQFIDARARERGLANLEIVTCDINRLDLSGHKLFDRVVSVEMFEHMRNYDMLLERVCLVDEDRCDVVRTHLHPQGVRLPVRRRATKATGWLGISSPAASCRATTCCCISSATCGSWTTGRSTGTHYQRTSEAWLSNMDAKRAEIMPILAEGLRTRKMQPSGGSTGACSSCPARSSGVTTAGANGSSRITSSRSVKLDAS